MDTYHTLKIRTGEGIVFSQYLAGPIPRMLAWAIDFVCMLGLIMILSTLIGLLAILSPALAQTINILLYFTISLGYGMTLEWFWRGQTIGKKIVRLRVVDFQGLRLQPSQIVIRNLLRLADLLPAFYLVGGLSSLCGKFSQRLGDIAANTVVIRIPKLKEPDLDLLLAGKFNSLRSYPHLEARLRQSISPTEASTALQALLRRDLLQPESRLRLFQEMARHFKEKVPFPDEATDGIADEQYLRNVVDVVFRVRPASHHSPDRSSPGLPHETQPSAHE